MRRRRFCHRLSFYPCIKVQKRIQVYLRANHQCNSDFESLFYKNQCFVLKAKEEEKNLAASK